MKFPVSFRLDLKGLEERISFLKEMDVNVEIVLADTAFNREISVRQLERLAVILRENELKVTAHLPFYDLRLASRDRHIVDYSMEVLTEALEIGKILGARVAVLHTGYTPHVPIGDMEQWMDQAAGNLSDLAHRATEEEMLLALENLWEPDADVFKGLLERVGEPSLGVCPDLGHAACYSSLAPEEWISTFGESVFNLHFHDNDGMEDQHAPCGQGVVGYDTILEAMQALSRPVNITLETEPGGIPPSMEHLRSVGFELES